MARRTPETKRVVLPVDMLHSIRCALVDAASAIDDNQPILKYLRWSEYLEFVKATAGLNDDDQERIETVGSLVQSFLSRHQREQSAKRKEAQGQEAAA